MCRGLELDVSKVMGLIGAEIMDSSPDREYPCLLCLKLRIMVKIISPRTFFRSRTLIRLLSRFLNLSLTLARKANVPESAQGATNGVRDISIYYIVLHAVSAP